MNARHRSSGLFRPPFRFASLLSLNEEGCFNGIRVPFGAVYLAPASRCIDSATIRRRGRTEKRLETRSLAPRVLFLSPLGRTKKSSGRRCAPQRMGVVKMNCSSDGEWPVSGSAARIPFPASSGGAPHRMTRVILPTWSGADHTKAAWAPARTAAPWHVCAWGHYRMRRGDWRTVWRTAQMRLRA